MERLQLGLADQSDTHGYLKLVELVTSKASKLCKRIHAKGGDSRAVCDDLA